MTKRLGRFAAPDDRDRDFAAPVLRASGRRMWNEGRRWEDQGELPHCVGFAWTHWLLGEPIRQYLPPSGVYRLAQLLDEWEGEDYEGTSVRAGAKALATLGLIERYEWAFSLEAVASAVLTTGPVVVGANWYAGMDRPRGELWRLSGRNLGGHAWVLTGVDTRAQIFRARNSHAGNARGWIGFADMEQLLAEEGEACLAIETAAL